MKKSHSNILIILILFLSCNNNENIELNCTSSLNYIERNGKVDSTMIDYIKKDYSRTYNIEFISKNDTLFAFGSTLEENNKNYRLGPNLTSKIRSNFELNCTKKIIIHQNEIKYSFCYSDVINFLDKQIKKSEKDVYYINHIGQKENLFNQIKESESIFYCDSFIYDLLMNLPYNAYDKYTKMQIPKIILSDYYSGWSGGSEYFLLDYKNDTIANHEFQRWVR